MLNSNFFDIRLSKRKNRLLFDYQILNIMVTSMHRCHCTQVPVSDKNESVRLAMQSESTYVLKTKALYKLANILLYICF